MAERFKPPPELGVELCRLRALEAAILGGGSEVVAPTRLPVGGADCGGGSAGRGPAPCDTSLAMLYACASSLLSQVGAALRALAGASMIVTAAVLLLAAPAPARINEVLDVLLFVNNWLLATLWLSCTPCATTAPDGAATIHVATSAAEAAERAVRPDASSGALFFVDAPPLVSAVINDAGLLLPVKQQAVALVAVCLGPGSVGSGRAAASDDEVFVYGLGSERITRGVLRRFAFGQWLSDENVNGVLSMLHVRTTKMWRRGGRYPRASSSSPSSLTR